MDVRKTPDPEIVSEMVRRIVETVHPLRIILFGSAARGEMGEHSDLDVLVIMSDGVHRRQTAQAIYRSFWGLGFAVDVLVATPSDIQNYGQNPSLVLFPALREGKEIYHAAG
ncbi:MAG: nucleotidyltransferase domain-containing protein [Candidatus Latescibacterota bacterium]